MSWNWHFYGQHVMNTRAKPNEKNERKAYVQLIGLTILILALRGIMICCQQELYVAVLVPRSERKTT